LLLEELLLNYPAVARCTIIGVPVPEVGELPKAFVVKQAGHEIDEAFLMDFVNQQVAPYKKIRELEFVKELPTSAVGKILKRVLREKEIKKRKFITEKAGP